MSERENWITTGKAADQLGMSRSWLQANSSSMGEPGKIPCMRTPGGDRRFHVDVIRQQRVLMGMEAPPLPPDMEPPPEDDFGPPPEEAEEALPYGAIQTTVTDFLRSPFQNAA